MGPGTPRSFKAMTIDRKPNPRAHISKMSLTTAMCFGSPGVSRTMSDFIFFGSFCFGSMKRRCRPFEPNSCLRPSGRVRTVRSTWPVSVMYCLS